MRKITKQGAIFIVVLLIVENPFGLAGGNHPAQFTYRSIFFESFRKITTPKTPDCKSVWGPSCGPIKLN
jgi:hypothetical protein